eukprot:gene46779-63384_t
MTSRDGCPHDGKVEFVNVVKIGRRRQDLYPAARRFAADALDHFRQNEHLSQIARSQNEIAGRHGRFEGRWRQHIFDPLEDGPNLGPQGDSAAGGGSGGDGTLEECRRPGCSKFRKEFRDSVF